MTHATTRFIAGSLDARFALALPDLLLRIRDALRAADQIVLHLVPVHVGPFAGEACWKGQCSFPPDENVLLSLLYRYRLALDHGFGVVLRRDGERLRHGLAHPPGIVCSPTELVAPFLTFSAEAARFFPDMQAQDRDDLLQDLYVRIHNKLGAGAVLLHPRAYFLSAAHHLRVSDIRRKRMQDRCLREVADAMRREPSSLTPALDVEDELAHAHRHCRFTRETLAVLRDELLSTSPDAVGPCLRRLLPRFLPASLSVFCRRLIERACETNEVNASRTAEELDQHPSTGRVYKVRLRRFFEKHLAMEDAA